MRRSVRAAVPIFARLRFLDLLAILFDPRRLRLVIEGPELGLHPDTLPAPRDMLIDASRYYDRG